MSKRKPSQLACSVAQAVDVIGDYWTMMILRDLMIFGGTRRFDTLCEALDISRNILTERLRTLLEDDIVIKQPISAGARRMEYQLTEKGWSLMPVLFSLYQWCQQWRDTSEEQSYTFVDEADRKEVFASQIMSHKGIPITSPADIDIVPLTKEAQDYLIKYR